MALLHRGQTPNDVCWTDPAGGGAAGAAASGFPQRAQKRAWGAFWVPQYGHTVVLIPFSSGINDPNNYVKQLRHAEEEFWLRLILP